MVGHPWQSLQKKGYLSFLPPGALHRTEAIIVNTMDFPVHLTFCQGVRECRIPTGRVEW